MPKKIMKSNLNFDRIEFANIVINGKNYGGKDLYVFYDGSIKERVKSHEVSREELELILRIKPEIKLVIVANGFYSCVKLSENALKFAKKKGVEIEQFETKLACEKFKKVVERGAKAALILHSTC